MTRLRFLGTGWSHGVPTLGCDCPVCTEALPRNRRLRASILLSDTSHTVVIDVGPDFREQALRANIQQLDAVFVTHQHSDHTMGLDDLRRFTWARKEPLPVWADPDTRDRLKVVYPYAAASRRPGQAVPLVEFNSWTQPVTIGTMRFTSFPVPHGNLPCYGVRIDTPEGKIGYVPDCSDLPPEAMDHLRDLDIMILNAMRDTPHPSHLSFDQSRDCLKAIASKRSFFTHMGCSLNYHRLQPTLPDGLEMAWDGMEVEL
ncbi:MAG: MBL fold metallo-hydrolase [Kiritimatiellia bacterium]